MTSLGSKLEEMEKDSTQLQFTVMTVILQMEMAAKDDATIVDIKYLTMILYFWGVLSELSIGCTGTIPESLAGSIRRLCRNMWRRKEAYKVT